MTCNHCGLIDCDCAERISCDKAGKPGHFMCGRKPCGCPRFVSCSHEGNRFDRGMKLDMPDSLLAGLITMGQIQ